MNLQKKIEYEFQKQMEELGDHTIGLAVSGRRRLNCYVEFSFGLGKFKEKSN